MQFRHRKRQTTQVRPANTGFRRRRQARSAGVTGYNFWIMSLNRRYLILTFCLTAALLCLTYPIYVIRPFRHQGTTELQAALFVMRFPGNRGVGGRGGGDYYSGGRVAKGGRGRPCGSVDLICRSFAGECL